MASSTAAKISRGIAIVSPQKVTRERESSVSIRMDDKFIYSLSGRPHKRVAIRDSLHAQERRLPYIKKIPARGRMYYYFVGPSRQIIGNLPHPGEPNFDYVYLERLAQFEALAIPPETKTDKSVVYFIGCEAAIKIGKARNVKRRLGEIQALSPVRLQVLATTPGNLRLEKEYHKRFAAHRLHGEWFAPHPDILAEIERLRDLA